jgi:crotonobetainyl-CoA:carnitine CoA-transferase CaiB-like acyl-CoA transferase
MRCRQMGARCAKLEPPPPAGAPVGASGDPMGLYNPAAYGLMHQGVRVQVADLKTSQGQAALHRELAKTDVLLTSFRPSALSKLGLDWKLLHRQYPALSLVAIVGAPGARAEEPGHDLTYLAEHDLVSGLTRPGAAVGGGHAGYRVYPCRDGRVAVAALEPHFARALCHAAGLAFAGTATMLQPANHDAIAAFLLSQSRQALDQLAVEKDIPLFTLPA